MEHKPTIRIGKQFRFECAHALSDYNGPCANIHGHSYELEIIVSGNPQFGHTNVPEGMIMDFSDLKAIVNYRIISLLDHKLIINAKDSEQYAPLKEKHSILELPYNPTCEMLLVFIHAKLIEYLPVHVRLEKVRLRETATSFAEWQRMENA